jgi:hypothetical protein
MGLTGLLRDWGRIKANNSGWPTFDGRFVNYPQFKKEREAYRQAYHGEQ